MKLTRSIAPCFLVFSICSASCSREDVPRPVQEGAKKIEAGARQLADYAATQKAQFVESAQERLDALGARVEAASESLRAELHAKREALAESLAELRASTAGAWSDSKRKVLDGLTWLERKLDGEG